MTINNSTYDYANDPYAVDVARVVEENNRKGTGDAPKVKWHNLPEGEAISTWRILPYPKKRSFFFKVTKHWNVPGFKGSVTCPRSFDDPANPGKKLRCAMCEKFFELYKSKDPSDVAVAKNVLKSSQSYYVNAVNMDKPEDGVGVLNVPYSAYQTLFNWLALPKMQFFSHPKMGRNIVFQGTIVPGASVPGQQKPKRNYSITPEEVSEILDSSWLEQLYDLEAILGIPTFELTEVALTRLLANDEGAAKLPEGTPAYRGQLMAPKEEAPNSVPQEAYDKAAVAQPSQMPPTTVAATEMPKFASAPTQPAPDGSVPTTFVGTNGKPVCFGKAFDESNQTCLGCSEIDACEVAVNRAKRAARATTQMANTLPTTTLTTEAPKSEDDIRKMMEDAMKNFGK